MAFPQLGNSDHVISFSIDFSINSKQDVLFRCVAYDYSRADWDGLHDHLRDVPWEDIFKLSPSSCQTPLILIVFSSLCCCHISQLFSFVRQVIFEQGTTRKQISNYIFFQKDTLLESEKIESV